MTKEEILVQLENLHALVTDMGFVNTATEIEFAVATLENEKGSA